MHRSIQQVEEAAAQAILLEDEERDAAIVAEAIPRLVDQLGGREIILVDSPALSIGFVTTVAQLLERRGVPVRVSWSRDARGLIDGVIIREAAQ